jgi:23S rRNA pseudouridine2605 synthase
MAAAEVPSRRVGLARALSKLGYCSRSQGFELIRNGRVRLNGNVARNPEAPVHLERDRIEVDQTSVPCAEKIYLMMNKPRGLVTSAADEKGRETVYSLLPHDLPWVAPIGRLDKASEGLLLFTNDSEWGARMLAPESHLDRNYHVQIRAQADDSLFDRLKRGVRTESGLLLSAKRVTSVRHGKTNSWIEIVLDEGKNRHIRRMLEGAGIEVMRLVRIAIGDLKLGDLPKGRVRPLTPEERGLLDENG